MMSRSWFSSTCTLVASACLASTSMAADGAAQGASASDSLEEIVVTAQKREQNINDVGLTVTVLGGDALKAKRIETLADLASAVPSLSYTNSPNGTPVYTMRGVGFYESSLGAYPTVSIYVDEVPLPFPAMTRHSSFDLERIEVLKGPQGILFGQNATGGAINYIAAKPTSEFHAGMDVSYGRFDEISAEGFVSGPLTETLQARFSGRVERADGWQYSNSRSGDSNGETDNYMGRILLAYTPTDSMRFLLNVNGWVDKSDTQAIQLLSFNVQWPGFEDPLLGQQELSPKKPRASDWTPGYTSADNHMSQASLRADFDFGPGLTLTSLTSYDDYDQNQSDDGDGMSLVTLDLPGDAGTITSFTQELRLSNGAAGPMRWLIGANMERSDTNQVVDLEYPNSSTNDALGLGFGYPIDQAHYFTDQNIRNYAAFGNIEYDIRDSLTVKLGARYTDSSDKAKSCNADLSGAPNNVGAFFYDVQLQGAFGPYQTGDCFIINDQAETIGGIPPGSPGLFQQKLDEDNVSWRVGLDFKPDAGQLFYANIAKGYKAGSFPTVSGSGFVQYLPVTQESVLSYEAGFKLSLLNRSLQLNGAAFYYDYKDKQLRSKLPTFFGILDVLQNVPKSSVKGVELEATARVLTNLSLSAAVTYLDTEIKDYAGTNAAGVEDDFSGSEIPYTPKWQAGANIDYTIPLQGGASLFMGASANYRASTDSVVGGSINPASASVQDVKLFEIGSYTLVDLRAGWKSADDHLTVSLWGKNVTDEYYWNNVVSVFDSIGRYVGKPATYGVGFSMRY